MEEDEKIINELIERSENESYMQPPLFEVYVTMLSMAIAVMMFVYPNMLLRDIEPYKVMIMLMPSLYWKMLFLGASLVKGIGLLLDNKFVRVAGLIYASIIYLLLALTFSADFPRLSALSFAVISVFSLLSIPQVRTTNINYKEG